MTDKQIEQVAADLNECKTEVGQQLEALRKDFDAFKTDFQELLEIFRASKGFLKVLAWIGRGIKWVSGIGIAVGVIWAMLNGQHK